MDYGWSLLKFVKVILVVTSVYWCILLSIIIYLLLGQCTASEADAAAVHAHTGLIMVLFVFMSVAGGVLIILVAAFHMLTQMYMSDSDVYKVTRVGQRTHSEYRKYTEPARTDWGIPPLIAFNTHFQRYANLETLVPLLCDRGVLQTTELEYLLDYNRRSEKISCLLTILDKKGKAGIDGVICCLKEDGLHLGHQDLTSILEDHYHQHHYGYVHS